MKRLTRLLGTAARTLGIALLCAVTLILIACVLFQSAGVRGRLLESALARADRELPGSLAVAGARWSAMGTITCERVLWTAGVDTLACLDSLRLELGVADLLRRDLRLALVLAECRSADLPAIRAAFGEAPPSREGIPAKATALPFIAEGSLPGFPSLALERLDLHGTHLRVGEALELAAFAITAEAELRREYSPSLALRRLVLSPAGAAWSVDEAAFDFVPEPWGLHGRAAGRLAPDWPLAIEAIRVRDGVTKLLLVGSGGGWTEPLRLELDLALADVDANPRSLNIDGAFELPGTRTLAGLPDLEATFVGLPQLPGAAGALSGTFGFGAASPGHMDLELLPCDWLEGGQASLRWGDGAMRLDTLRVALPGLVIAAKGSVRPDSVTATLAARAAGAKWWTILLPAQASPDSLVAALDCTLSGPRASPRLAAALTAAGRWGGFRLDGLRALGSSNDLGARTAELELAVQAADLILSTAARLGGAEPLVVELAPLQLQRKGESPSEAPRRFPGSLRRESAGGWSAENVKILGVAGALDLAAEWREGGAGSLRFLCGWPELPALFVSRVPPERSALIAERWRRHGGFFLSGEVALLADASVAGRGRFLLPGPAIFTAPPASLHLDEPETLAGEFELDAPALQGPFGLDLDLGASAWIDSGVVRIRVAKGTFAVEEAVLKLAGLAFDAIGEWEDGSGRITAAVAVVDSSLLRATLGAPAAPAAAALRLEGEVAGSPAGRRLALSATGSLRGPGYVLPEVEGSMAWGPAAGQAAFRAPAGAVLGAMRLETASLEYRSEGMEPFPGGVALKLDGPEFAAALTMRLERSEQWASRVDSLRLLFRGRSLASTAPFRLQIDPRAVSLRLDSLSLSGTAGWLRAGGLLHATASDFEATASLALPPRPVLAMLPQTLWPESFNLEFRARGQRELHLRALAGGLRPFGDEPFNVDVSITGADSLRLNLAVASGADTMLRAALVLPPPRALIPLDSLIIGERLRFEARADGLPVPLAMQAARSKLNPTGRARLDGRVVMGGSAAAPVGRADLTLSFPAWPKLDTHRFGLAAVATAPAPATTVDGALPADGAIGKPGISASLFLSRNDRELLRARLRHDAWLSLDPPALQRNPTDSLAFDIASGGFALDDFDALFPEDVGVSGTCRMELGAKGAAANPELTGWLEAEALNLTRPDGSQVRAKALLAVAGTLRRPELEGHLDVVNGVLRIPDPPPNLHPVAGESLLWLADASAARVGERPLPAPDLRQGRGLGDARVDVEVMIPSGLWLKGKGLEVELSGELLMTLREGRPILVGNLSAVQGFLLFLGRGFNVDRGNVAFYGDDEMDPTLELHLSTRLSDTLIHIAVSGTLKEPVLALSSEPSMNEGDIMGLLFFGRPLDELSGDQIDLLQRRTTDIATAFSTARLERAISNQLGVDQVSIRGGQRGDSALIMGKYLSRKVLLKYEQTLDSFSDFYVNVEYFLTREYKIETLFGQRGHSGLEVIWAKEY